MADLPAPVQDIIDDLKKMDLSSPMWWVGVITAAISEVVSLLTLVHADGVARHFSAVTQGEIVMVSQVLAVGVPLVISWFHQKAKLAALAALQSIHYNQTALALEQTARAALPVASGGGNSGSISGTMNVASGSGGGAAGGSGGTATS